jgi:uncharacterized membrane protein YraQ (UPF0718 family)
MAWIQLVIVGIAGAIVVMANYGMTGRYSPEVNPLGVFAALLVFFTSVCSCTFLLALASIAENLAHLRRHIAGGRFSEN